MTPAPERLVAAYLTSRANDDLCDACLSKHTSLSHAVVLDQLTILARTPFLRDVWKCVDCDTGGTVTRALVNRGEA